MDNLDLSAQVDVELGFYNVLEITELGIGIEALGDKIVVLMDSYRSGYECTTCKGIGKIKNEVRCVCDPLDWDENKNVARGTRNRFGEPCLECMSNYMQKRKTEIVTCPTCKGKGSTLIIPDSAKSLPTTGIVISCGPDVTKIKNHCRIIATPHSGIYIPMKGNVPVKIYHEYEPLAYIYNINPEHDKIEEMIDQNYKIIDIPSSGFIEYDTPLGKDKNI